MGKKKLMVLKVKDANTMFANPCCCTTETEEGACIVWTKSSGGAPETGAPGNGSMER